MAKGLTKIWGGDSGPTDLGLHGQAGIGDVVDRVLIQEAFSRWGVAYDKDRMDVLASLFTDDAHLEVAVLGGKPFLSVRGREAVLDQIKQVRDLPSAPKKHLFSNIIIEALEKERAAAAAYTLVITADGSGLPSTAMYSGRLVKEADGFWRFSYLLLDRDSPSPLSS